ncbi:MAG TPA: hypothetical protein VFL56_01110 [Solirubrobacterales bacterium]|nr:hypothetical protein [Solirubrobacterales bacterium]
MIYRVIGKAVVKLTLWLVLDRYRRQIRVAFGVLVVGGAIAAYLAARDVPEG